YGLLLSPPVIAAFALAAAAVGVAALIQRAFPEPRAVKVLERFAGAGPLTLGLHLGLALVVAAVVGLLFVPSLPVPTDDGFGFAILVVEAMCGLMFVLGLATRAAAILLALLGLVAMVPFSFESILEQVHVLGIATFLFLVGRGPFSLDRVRGVQPPFKGGEIPAAALTLVRVAMGFGIAYNALTEKLLNPPLVEAFIATHPQFNAARALGVPDAQFGFLAGVIEFVIGAVLVSPYVTRPVAAIGAVIFTGTLFVLGLPEAWSELLGHLPFFGIFFLLVVAPNASSWRVRRALRPAA
ncbi:MAG: hypothetical protein ACRDM0_20575, partial [Thermoleophilaceae bacterium]